MHVDEVAARLHELGAALEGRAGARAAYTTDGLTPGERRVGVLALEDDARFLHSLAEQLEKHQAHEYDGMTPPVEADLAVAIAAVCMEGKDR